MFFSYVAAFELKGIDYVKDKVQNELLTQASPRAAHPPFVAGRDEPPAMCLAASIARRALAAFPHSIPLSPSRTRH